MQPASPNAPGKISPFEGFLPFFWLSIAAVAGIILADQFGFPIWVWFSGLLICVLIWGLSRWLPENLRFTHQLRHWTQFNQRMPGIFLGVIFFLAGCRLVSLESSLTPSDIAYYNDRGIVQITGLVIQPPDIRDTHTKLLVDVESLRIVESFLGDFAPGDVSGKVLLQVPSNRAWAYGDRVMVTGELSEPYESGNFSYKEYLANKNIPSLMSYARVERVEPGQGAPFKTFVFRLRQKSHETLQAIFPSPEADLLSGILLGRDQGISQDLQNAFQVTGMTHIIAISGFNISILAGLFSNIFTRILGHRSGALAAILAVAAYTLLVGAEAAVVRAAIIGTIGVLGGVFGRRQNSLNSLGLAVLGMLIVDPRYLWDIGFQLSVAATLGLVLYSKPMASWFVNAASRWISEDRANALVGPVSEILLISLAAQIMTMPLMAYHFGEISWLALIANPLILPPQPFVMIMGGLALLAGLILPGLGNLFALLAIPFVRYTIRMVSIISSYPGAELKLPDFHIIWLLIFYGLLFILTLTSLEKRKTLIQKAFSPSMALLVLTGGVVFVWNHVLSKPDGNLFITLLDQEGTIFIQTPDGKTLLIGGGPSPSYLKQALGQNLPVGEKSLDVLVITSSSREDLNALTGTLQVYSPELVLWGISPESNQTSRAVYALLEKDNSAIEDVQIGQSLNLGSGISLEFLKLEDRGGVIWLCWDNFRAILYSGKIDSLEINIPEKPDVVLLPDDIKGDELHLETLNQWSPSVILYPIGEKDIPLIGEHESLALLSDYPVITTLDHQWVRITTDGKKMWASGQ